MTVSVIKIRVPICEQVVRTECAWRLKLSLSLSLSPLAQASFITICECRVGKDRNSDYITYAIMISNSNFMFLFGGELGRLKWRGRVMRW